MKIMLLECDAEELRANRTVLDSIVDAIGAFTQSFAGISGEKVLEAMQNYSAEEEPEEDKDEHSD